MEDRKALHPLMLICFLGIALSACSPNSNTVILTEEVPAETEEMVVEEGEVLVETEEVPIETEEVVITDTSTPEATGELGIHLDELDDCSLRDGTPTDCLGIDIESIVMDFIRSNDDLILFNTKAGEAGFVPVEMPVTVEFPFIITAIRIVEYDPDASFICINWADQQTAIAPSDSIANTLATCYNPRHEFLYVNNIDSSGKQGVQADPEGTLVFMEPTIGITFVQEQGRIFVEEPAPPIDVLAVANDQPRFDKLRVETFTFTPVE